MKVSGSTFLVSGGSSGLGATVVRSLAGEGANVVIADVNDDTGRQLASECSPNVLFVHADVADESNVRAAIQAGLGGFKELNGAVSCAGIAPAERLLGKSGPHSLALFQKVIAVNLVGTFNVARLAAEAISRAEPRDEGERGVIINTASVAAFEGQVGQAAYAASKGGIIAMTLPLARELARFGIRVVTIAPGMFDTPLMAALPEQVRQSLGKQVPYPPRLGRPAEFAALVLHIVENRMLNGEVIRIDGALRLAGK